MAPKAGFWAIGGYEISFRSDGHWYADDEVIENSKIELLFSRHVRSDGGDGWVIDLGIDRQPVRIQDTPLVVRTVDGDPAGGFFVTANDGVRDELSYETLRVGRDDVLYCDLKRSGRGTLPARFLRPAYYALAAWMEEADGRTYLTVDGKHHRVAHAEPARRKSQ